MQYPKWFVLSILFGSLILYTFADNSDRVTFCSVLNPKLEDRSIDFHKDVISNADSKVQFVFGSNRYECLEKLLRQEADFGVFLGEDLTLIPLVNASASNSLLITHEFRQRWNRTYRFDMVALRWNNGTSDLNDLKNVSICHPGSNEYGWLFDFSDVLLQFLAGVHYYSLRDTKLTNYENKLKSLNSFLGPSCLPGPWSPSPYVDRILKRRYSNLCKLCHDKSNSCLVNDTFWGRDGSLECFSSCTGNVLWFREQHLESAVRHLPPQAKCRLTKEFPLVCPPWDPISTADRPCIWISRPWPVIVSQNSSVESVTKLITHINSSSSMDNSQTTWESALRTILLSSSRDPIYAAWSLPPEEYLTKVHGLMEAKSLAKSYGSKVAVKICVENKHLFTQCNFMVRVAKVYSIDPEIKCYLQRSCLSRLFKFQYEAYLTYGEELESILRFKIFKIILHQSEDDLFKYRYTYAVVRKESTLKTYSDLKGKRACFARRSGQAWNSLLFELMENSLIPSYCYGSQKLANFFDEICVTDRNDLWIPHCFRNEKNYFSTKIRRDEAEALRCLAENRGDVAFLDYKWIERYLGSVREKTGCKTLILPRTNDIRYFSTLQRRCTPQGYIDDFDPALLYLLLKPSLNRSERTNQREHHVRDTNRNQTWVSNLEPQDFKPLCRSSFNDKFSEPCYLSKESTRKIFVLNEISDHRKEEILFAILIASSFLAIKNVIFNIDFRMFRLPKFNGRESSIVHEDDAVDFQVVDEYEKYVGDSGSYEARLKKMVVNCPPDRKPNFEHKYSTIFIYAIVVLMILFLVPTVIVISKIW